MATSATNTSRPGHARLWRHSYRLGFSWLRRTARHGFKPGRKPGFQRLLVPLDPWRFYEMGVLADRPFNGRCLDVSSPKLLTSLLQREGSGDWLGIDLFTDEIAAWRAIDPALDLEVQNATSLPYDDNSFDTALSVSVVEHMGRGNDTTALREIFRVVKPGGMFYLTTMVAANSRDVFGGDEIYGNASERVDDERVFFEHVYSPAEFAELTQEAGWITTELEYAVQTKPKIQDRFYRWAPFSYILSPLLRIWFPRTIAMSSQSDVVTALPEGRSAVVNVTLVKPTQ
ncbi:MAG: class I SAM-dependent methyltransferase [Solirubrobacterales bacterium]|nr:class I SAM-dependent methyltransferase [Solirubrobacterales bacterium]